MATDRRSLGLATAVYHRTSDSRQQSSVGLVGWETDGGCFGGVGRAGGIGRAVPEVVSCQRICAERSYSATALILEFMPGSNVLSQKYMIWLTSLAPLRNTPEQDTQ